MVKFCEGCGSELSSNSRNSKCNSCNNKDFDWDYDSDVEGDDAE